MTPELQAALQRIISAYNRRPMATPSVVLSRADVRLVLKFFEAQQEA